MKYDEERDQLDRATIEAQRWDTAWQVYDEVNEDLCPKDMRDPDEPYFVHDKNLKVQEIDLNCLDAEEAQAICKQKIFDIAQVV